MYEYVLNAIMKPPKANPRKKKDIDETLPKYSGERNK
jgi:hypothetical protein